MKVKSEIKKESRSRVEKNKVMTDVKMEIKSEIKSEISKLSKGKGKILKEGDSPFPEFSRPNRDDCISVVESLTAIHGIKEAQNSIRPVLDSLIRTILSQNTTDKTSMIAFQNLKNVCPTWKSTLAADDSVIEEAIRFGGLAEIKTKRTRIILEDILNRHGMFIKYLHQFVLQNFLRNIPYQYSHLDNTTEFHNTFNMTAAVCIIHNMHSILRINYTQVINVWMGSLPWNG
jgi:hypothetical protein